MEPDYLVKAEGLTASVKNEGADSLHSILADRQSVLTFERKGCVVQPDGLLLVRKGFLIYQKQNVIF